MPDKFERDPVPPPKTRHRCRESQLAPAFRSCCWKMGLEFEVDAGWK